MLFLELMFGVIKNERKRNREERKEELSSFLPFSPPCFSSARFLLLQTSIQEKAKPGDEARDGPEYAVIKNLIYSMEKGH